METQRTEAKAEVKSVLLKSDSLTTKESDVIRKHPIYTYDLFSHVEFLRSCLSIPYLHHEKRFQFDPQAVDLFFCAKKELTGLG